MFSLWPCEYSVCQSLYSDGGDDTIAVGEESIASTESTNGGGLPQSFFQKPFRDPRLEPDPVMVPSARVAADDLDALERLFQFALVDSELKETASRETFVDIALRKHSDKNKRRLLNEIAADVPSFPMDQKHDTGSLPHRDIFWKAQFQNLLMFKRKFGHCGIRMSVSHDKILGRWVKRQRYQYKRFQQSKPSCMNLERIQLLESIGFAWNAHDATWDEKLNQLCLYKQTRGNSNIPSHDPANPQLSTWAKCQRRQYRLFMSGMPSNMTTARIEKMNLLGFVWTLRKAI